MKEVMMSSNLINDILINSVLKEFYKTYLMDEKTGIIVNHKGGAMLYDKIEKELHKIEVPQEEKKRIWAECKKGYMFWYAQYKDYPKEEQKKLLEQYYKSSLCEYHLNSLLKPDFTGQVISFDDIPSDIVGLKKVE